MLIDQHAATVGTANFDNRSMRLNFEVTVLVLDKDFAREVEEMLLVDFAASHQVSAQDFNQRSLPFRFASRVARLLSPIQ